MEKRQPVITTHTMGEGVVAFSTTRHGGYGSGAYGEFNINPFCGDDATAVSRNREALCQWLGIADSHLLLPHQTHDTRIAAIDKPFLSLAAEEQATALEGVDALMTTEKGVCIGVSTADCIPLLLFDPVQRAVCAVHAGWRGTVKRIAQKAVVSMEDTYGSRPADIIAVTGPGISLESFEVGQEVYDTFEAAGFPMTDISRRYPASQGEEKWHIGLPQCNRMQLIEAGLQPRNISLSPVCTFQQSANYFSARRLGIASGRIYTAAMLL